VTEVLGLDGGRLNSTFNHNLRIGGVGRKRRLGAPRL
jgi:hypothetical protein